MPSVFGSVFGATVTSGGEVTLSEQQEQDIINGVATRVQQSIPRIQKLKPGQYEFTAADTWIKEIVATIAVGTARVILTIKDRNARSDDDALLFLSDDVGLERLNGSSHATAADGSLTWDSEKVSFRIESNITKLLPYRKDLLLSVKGLSATSDVTYERNGTLEILSPGVAAITS